MNGPPQKPTTAWSSRSSRADDPDGLEDRRHRVLGLGRRAAARRRPCVAIGLLDDRADVLDQLDLDAHAEDGEHDVREHHGRVHAVAPDRLQRHLRAELGLPHDLEEAVALADLAVLRAASARPGA